MCPFPTQGRSQPPPPESRDHPQHNTSIQYPDLTQGSPVVPVTFFTAKGPKLGPPVMFSGHVPSVSFSLEQFLRLALVLMPSVL